ncbi:MAG: flagellar assembly protein FliX [Caulobacteraceae bacterium]|nr:flagellar assembly protein FliX [Caulobacteraceae bacterium]
MKIGQTHGPGQAASAGAPRPAPAGGFKVSGTGSAAGVAQTARAAGMAGVVSVDALLALQDVGGPLERRRRQVRRSSRLLDRLDEIKLALLEGRMTRDAVLSLKPALREQREAVGEAPLQLVLDEIETRAAVELAKLETRAAA